MRGLIQRKNFNSLRGEFKTVYEQLNRLGKQPFLMTFWENVNKMVATEFLPTPPWDFLGIRAIKDTMFVQPSQEWIDAEYDFLRKKLGPKLPLALREDAVGQPSLSQIQNARTSYNTLHHLYHIYFYLHKTRLDIDRVKSVVEWGGGYGNFAKLWQRLNPGGTFIIIDTFLFCAIQWLYLSTTLGRKEVNLLRSKEDELQNGKINILPLALLEKAPEHCDLFVSTWGLSESSAAAQDYVIKQKWFGAEHLLIGFQDSIKELKYASRLGELAAKNGAKIVDIKFIPHNHYAIK